MGVYGEILYPLSDLNENLHQSSSKNNIAENSVALGHETLSSYETVVINRALILLLWTQCSFYHNGFQKLNFTGV